MKARSFRTGDFPCMQYCDISHSPMRMLFTILALFLLPLFFPISGEAQPSLLFEHENHDFGEVLQGSKLEHTFEFTNSGDQDLLISKLAPS